MSITDLLLIFLCIMIFSCTYSELFIYIYPILLNMQTFFYSWFKQTTFNTVILENIDFGNKRSEDLIDGSENYIAYISFNKENDSKILKNMSDDIENNDIIFDTFTDLVNGDTSQTIMNFSSFWVLFPILFILGSIVFLHAIFGLYSVYVDYFQKNDFHIGFMTPFLPIYGFYVIVFFIILSYFLFCTTLYYIYILWFIYI